MKLGKQQLEEICRNDPLAYAITYIALEQNRPWTLAHRQWSIDIFNAVNPAIIEKNPDLETRQMVLQKPTQVGMSTMSASRLFHFADFWAIRGIYMLPRQQDYIDWVTTRIDPIIANSPRLKEKLGSPDSTRAKQLGDSYLFFMESTVEPRMMPADILMIDELDLSDPVNVATANTRLDNSIWKLKFYFSTPTIPSYGVNGKFSQSDQREWLVKCESCGTWQEMDWEKNLTVVGNKEKPSDLFLRCIKCSHRFTLEEINNNGKWVSMKPDIKDMVGFHISHLMVFPIKQIYMDFLNPEQPIYEFYRKRLGKPYEIEGGSISREDFLMACFMELSYEETEAKKQGAYFMGIDQGNNLQVVILKRDEGKNGYAVVHLEEVPFQLSDGRGGFERIADLMNIYKISKAVIDANPNRHSARSLQKKFPGRIILADYANIRERYVEKKGQGKEENITIEVAMNRTQTIDNTLEIIRKGRLKLYGNPTNLPPIVETYITHFTSLRRDIEQRRTETATTTVAVWKSIRADHFVHASAYGLMAAELGKSGVFRIYEIKGEGNNNQKEGSINLLDFIRPPQDVLQILGPHFGEVRQEQAKLYFKLKAEGKLIIENLPQPLRNRLVQTMDLFDIKHIEWILLHISMYDNAPLIEQKPLRERVLRIR